MAIRHAQPSTIQAMAAFSQNRNGSSTHERHQIEERGQQLAGDELAHPMDLADVVHRLAGRMPLEVVERQAQQPVEHVQVDPGVDPGADHEHDQPPRITQQRLVDDGDADDDRDQRQGRIGVVGQHLVDHGHDQERREDGQNAQRERSDTDLAQRALLLQHEAEQPAQRERRVGFREAAVGAQQHRLAAPHFAQPQFVHRYRRIARGRRRVLDEGDLVFGVDAGQQARGAVVEQQHHRPGVVEPHEVAPAQPHRARPHAGVLRPAGKRRGGRRRIARRAAEIAGIEFQPVVAAGDDHGEQARMDRRLLGSAEMDRHAAICAAAGVGDRMWPLPRRAGDMSVVYIHLHSPSEACPMAGAFASVRADPELACSDPGSSRRQSNLQRRKAGERNVPHSGYNMPAKPQPDAGGPGKAGHDTANGTAGGRDSVEWWHWTTRWEPSSRDRAWSAGRSAADGCPASASR